MLTSSQLLISEELKPMEEHISYSKDHRLNCLKDEAKLSSTNTGEKRPLDYSSREESHPHIVKGTQKNPFWKTFSKFLSIIWTFPRKTNTNEFSQRCLFMSSRTRLERNSLWICKYQRSNMPHVNETETRLSIYKPCPSPRPTKHLTATVAAFLWLVLQQTSAFTLGNGLTCSSQSPRLQSALSCLFYNWDRTTHKLWPWPGLVLFKWLLRCILNSGTKTEDAHSCLKLMNSHCSACHRCRTILAGCL